MGNSCSSSKGSYSTSTANPWIESALPPPTSTLQQPSVPALHEGSILGSAHAGNGNTSNNNSSSRVLTCGEDKRIALFDWEHPTDRVYFEGHGRPVNQVPFDSIRLNVDINIHLLTYLPSTYPTNTGTV